MNMQEQIKINKYSEKDYGNAVKMTSFEKKISFLNRYFVYKKIREVNTEKVEIELSEYQGELMKNNEDTRRAIEVSKDEEKKLKPKLRKLSKKLVLIGATTTEAVIDEEKEPEKEPEKKKEKGKKKEKEPEKKKKPSKVKPAKPLIIIESDEEE